MSISDPAQLLQRIPELHLLAELPQIRRAIETGDPFKVYRALILARLFRRLPEHRELLNTLISERRLFAKGYKNRPYLAGMNALGFSFLGAAETDTDDSHIALHAFTILSTIPLIPLGCYVVKKTGERQWHIYARAPLGILGWLYTRGLALALVTLILFGAVHSYHQASTQDMTLLNGFELPVLVTLNQTSMTVPPQGRATINLKHGIVSGSASFERFGMIEQFRQTINSNDHTMIWNIAGAAPLLHTSQNAQAASEGSSTLTKTVYCGSSFLEFADLKEAFGKATESINSQNSGQLTMLSSANSPELPGISICSNYALEHARENTMASALEALALMHEWDEAYTLNAVKAAQQVSTTEALRVLQRARKAHHDTLAFELRYQELRDEAGQHQALQTEYAEYARLHPDSASAQFLYASLFSGSAGISAMQESARRFPQDAAILRSLVWRKAIHADYSGAQQDLNSLRQLSPKDADLLLNTELSILLSQGRKLDALNLLNALMRDKKAGQRAARAADFALVARQAKADPEHWFKQFPAADNDAESINFHRIRAGLPVAKPSHAQSPYVKLALALRNNPTLAIKLAKEFNRYQLSSLAPDQILLLHGEAVRRKDQTLISLTQDSLNLSRFEAQILHAYMRGEEIDLDQSDFDIGVQAGAFLIRSRNMQLSDQERASLRARAAKTDFMRGAVSTALHQWPA